MRVLYALSKYPQLSETYVAAEIAFMLRSGVDVRVWSPFQRDAEVENQCTVYRESAMEAVHAFDPDIVHAHHISVGFTATKSFEATKLPITVRGHSFDFHPSFVDGLLSIERVKKVYLFPHFARQMKNDKVVALPVAFDSTKYQLSPSKDERMVLRLGAGLSTKSLRTVFEVSALAPRFRFVLGLASCDEGGRVADALARTNPTAHVSMFKDVGWDSAAQLTRRAGIFLHTSDPSAHPFGMPISIAESLATGSLVFIRDSMAAREYAGDAALYYNDSAEVANTLNSIASWTPDQWAKQRERSAMQGALYRDEVVLPRLIHDWEGLLGARR